jgi:hypothetical protein
MEPYVRNYSEFRDYMKMRSLYGSEEEVDTKQSEPPKGFEETELVSSDSPQAMTRTEMGAPGDSITNNDPYQDSTASSESTSTSPDP